MADRTPRCTSWMFAKDLCVSKIYVIHNIFKCICKEFIYFPMFPMLPKCRCHFGGRGFWYFICCTPRCTNHVKNACTGFTVDISSICKRVNKYQISNFPSYEWISKSALGRQSQDLQIDTALLAGHPDDKMVINKQIPHVNPRLELIVVYLF